jgi:hypothetical protein
MIKRGLIVIAIAVALTGATGASSAPPSVQLDADLPLWLAPGVTLALAGTSDPETVIAVVRGGSTVASTTAGQDGRFSMRSVLARTGAPVCTG